MSQQQNQNRQVRTKSIFERIFCCGNSEDVAQPLSRTDTTYSVQDYLKQKPENSQSVYQMGLRQGYYVDQLKKIKSKRSLKDLRISNTKQNTTQYSCPICFRYFNVILVSNCCYNYICHLCALEYQNLKCHFCMAEQCNYIDVQKEKEIKIYTDSQGMQNLKEMLQKGE